MGMMLYSALFTDEELLRNYDFYQTVTLHHSSLSTCIFGISGKPHRTPRGTPTPILPSLPGWIWMITMTTSTLVSMPPIWPAHGRALCLALPVCVL